MLGAAKTATDLGREFGATLTEREVCYLISDEWACTVEDVIWRRSKLGLRMSAADIAELKSWFAERTEAGRPRERKHGHKSRLEPYFTPMKSRLPSSTPL